MKKSENFAAAGTRPLIAVMAKTPTPGTVKTRLAPLISEIQSAQIALAFLEDTLKTSINAAPDVMLAYAPCEGEKVLREVLTPAVHPPSHLWLAQQGDDLGARLEFVAARGFELDFSPLIIIGSDSPSLPLSFIQSAIQSLAKESCDIVLGPTDDGGFYLLGLNAMQRNLYQHVTWSTPNVLAQVKTNAENLNLHVELLERWYDVDTPKDLQKLNSALLQNPNVAPRTTRWLQEHQFLFAR